eukprot:6173390-Pleurochrysis_carterae.AAC.3
MWQSVGTDPAACITPITALTIRGSTAQGACAEVAQKSVSSKHSWREAVAPCWQMLCQGPSKALS